MSSSAPARTPSNPPLPLYPLVRVSCTYSPTVSHVLTYRLAATCYHPCTYLPTVPHVLTHRLASYSSQDMLQAARHLNPGKAPPPGRRHACLNGSLGIPAGASPCELTLILSLTEIAARAGAGKGPRWWSLGRLNRRPHGGPVNHHFFLVHKTSSRQTVPPARAEGQVFECRKRARVSAEACEHPQASCQSGPVGRGT